jgi:hypothetical protein
MDLSQNNIEQLNSIILKRASKRGLSIDLDRMIYAHDSLFSNLGERRFQNALFVGIGHGHDALLTLFKGKVEKVLGVDPYIETDGNGEGDYLDLIEASQSLGLADKIKVFKGTIQEYFQQGEINNKFDLVIISDVLHHIFVTEEPLSKSNFFPEACDLFKTLKSQCTPSAVLAIADVERHGLRPLIHTYGPLKREVEYKTKQSAKEWTKAIEKGGWKMLKSKNYIPYAIRKMKFLEMGGLARKTLLERYLLYFTPN